MNHNAQRYRSKLKKKLHCMRKTQCKLLGEFDCMLNGFLDENPDASFDDLCSAFGPPEEMARILMAEISGKKHANIVCMSDSNAFSLDFVPLRFLSLPFIFFFYKEFCNVTYSKEIYIDLP